MTWVCPEIRQAWGGGDNWAELTGKGACGALQWALLLSCHPDSLWAVLVPQLAQSMDLQYLEGERMGEWLWWGDRDGVMKLGRTSWWAGHAWLSVVGRRAVNDFAKKTGAENMKLFWANKKIQSRLHESLSVMRNFWAWSIAVITSVWALQNWASSQRCCVAPAQRPAHVVLEHPVLAELPTWGGHMSLMPHGASASLPSDPIAKGEWELAESLWAQRACFPGDRAISF